VLHIRPKGFKTLDFATFYEVDYKLTMEHIGRFIVHCNEGNPKEIRRLHLFPLSLLGTTFTWYFYLPPNSIQTRA